jgi:ABC-2 type transport system permease protein
MITTICWISVQRLWNNKQELLLTLAVPMMFFTIFALIFSRGVGEGGAKVRVAFVDDDRTPESQAIIQEASQHPELQPMVRTVQTSVEWPIGSLSRVLICRFDAEVVIHIPAGFTTQDPQMPTLSIQLFDEGTSPIGPQIVQARMAESIAMELSKANLAAIQEFRPEVPEVTVASGTSAIKAPSPSPSKRLTEPRVFESINAFASNKHQPKIALYAAGIAVMFLLFSASGAGASLLEEREAGTLRRLLNSRLTLTELLLGKWLYITGLGTVQLTLMFIWGQLVFHVDLQGHWLGFGIMTVATSAACASFGLFLSALCQSRQQLNAVSIVLVLSMSAIGGSMVPRYVMSESMKSLGKLTFNGWALDGFQKIFWYELPVSAVRMEVAVLMGISVLFALVARVMAERWRLA